MNIIKWIGLHMSVRVKKHKKKPKTQRKLSKKQQERLQLRNKHLEYNYNSILNLAFE